MKILLINTHSNGGAAKACIRLHLSFLKAGINSKLLFLDDETSAVPKSIVFRPYHAQNRGFYSKVKEKIYTLRRKRKVSNLPKGYEVFHLATSIFDITQHPAYKWADIIHLHWVANFIDFASFFKKNTKPVVWTLHDMWPFTGGYHYEKGFPFDAYEKIINQTIKLKQQALGETALKVVSPSLWLQRRSQESQLFRKFEHYHIPNSLNPCLFQPLDKTQARVILGLPKDKKIVLFVADSINNKRKGFSFIIDAFNRLNINNLYLAIIGQYKGKRIQQERVFYLGQIANEKFMHIGYSAADLFTISSVEDNFPNTILESLFCGTPVVGFNIGGIPDMIQNGQNGYLCPTIDAATLAQTIDKALKTPFDPKAIRENAIKKYNPELQAKRYIKLFQTLVATSTQS